MWIFTKHAVLSVVEYDPTNGYADDGIAPHDHTWMFVRSRRREHLTDFGFGDSEVIETPRNDYPFRVLVKKDRVAEMMARSVREIDYENFKGACMRDGDHPYDMLHDVWESVMRNLDDRTPAERPF